MEDDGGHGDEEMEMEMRARRQGDKEMEMEVETSRDMGESVCSELEWPGADQL